MDKEKLLQLNNLHVNYGSLKALNDISMFVDEGEIVALMGPNPAKLLNCERSGRTGHC
jgi:ABC-type branched-subunit amino acid transport system ATPase component